MAESMFVRCEDCNYENLAQHSFCGMCGAKLPSPRRAAPPAPVVEPVPVLESRSAAPELQPAPAPQRSISGPSLLGLGSEPTERERITYLLEDEPESGSWRRWAAVFVLAAAVGGAGWHWRTEIREVVARASKNAPADTTLTATTTAGSETAPSTTPSNPAPATPAPAAEGNASSAPPPSAGVSQDPGVSQPAPAVTDAVARAPETKEEPKEEKPSDLAASPATIQPTAQPLEPQPTKPKVERKVAATDASADALETQGEDYLYGHGVQADCGRAGKSLLAAAAHSSLKAQSVLGTMYATGHCVTRDLPVAYRWFAKASHQDPANVRLQRDLEVLWAQMTPEEREIATKAAP